MQKEIRILINNFNESAFTLLNFMNDVSPKSSFCKFIKPIHNLIRKESNKMIDIFVLDILKYESYIMSKNDELNNKFYYGELEKNPNKIMKMFDFKSIWSLLNDQNRSTIKIYMELLCKIARTYFNIIYQEKLQK